MFQWKDFKTVGDELMINSQEAYIRCATSRYYYSIFGSTREYLINIINISFAMEKIFIREYMMS